MQGGAEESVKDSLSEIISNGLSNENKIKVESILQYIICTGVDYNDDVVEPLGILLKENIIDLQRMTAQAIAEMCKCENKRTSYSNAQIVDPLLIILNQSINNDNVESIKQSCRALGNICFDNSVGRDLVFNLSGLPIIIDALEKSLKYDDGNLKSHCHSIRLFTCKLLSILMFGGNDYIKPALDAGLMNKMYDVIQYEFSTLDADDDRLHSALLVVNVITEYYKSLVVDEKLTVLIVEILKTIKNLEISEVCLEYLHYQSEHDEVKTILASVKVPQILWSLLQKHKSLAVDEETCELMKLTCDLIALILTGDESMDILFADGMGEFYLSMIESLNSDDVELAITAILAVGNFARTDTHCIHMMDTGVFKKLMSILLQHKNHEDDVRLQHVVLSGLRNLVIPQRNKSLAVNHGILPVLIEMIPNVEQYHVVFKLLATLRMLVDGQEIVARELAIPNILDKVAVWGAQSEHAGVAGEASRLIARIVRQLQTLDRFVNVVKVGGCISCLVNMLAAPHMIMQNEAIVALTILCSAILNADIEEKLNENIFRNGDNSSVSNKYLSKDDVLVTYEIRNSLIDEMVKSNISKQLNIMLERNSHSAQVEIIENVSKFISLLVIQEPIRKHMYQNKTHGSLKDLLSQDVQLKDSLKKIIGDLIERINIYEYNANELEQ